MTYRDVVSGVVSVSVIVLAASLSAVGGRPDGQGGAAAGAGAAVEPDPVVRAAVSRRPASPGVEAADAGRCDVSPGPSNQTIVVGRLLLGAEGAEPGAVLVAGGRIAAVGEPGALRPEAPEATVIDCGAAWVSPGLVNAHEHPNVSGGLPDPRMRPVYSHREQWQGLAGDELEYSRTEAPVRQFWIELRHLLAGTTTLGGSGAVVGLLKNASWADDPAYAYRADMQTFPYGTATETFSGLTCPYEDRRPSTRRRAPAFRRTLPIRRTSRREPTARRRSKAGSTWITSRRTREGATRSSTASDWTPRASSGWGAWTSPSSGRPGRIWPCTTRRWTCRTPWRPALALRLVRTGPTRARTTSSRSSAAPRASMESCGATACRDATSGRWPPGTAPTPSASTG